MTVLYIGDFGQGILAAEAVLAEACRQRQRHGDAAMVVTVDPAFTAHAVTGPVALPIGPLPSRPVREVVLIGPIGRARRVPPLLAMFRAAVAAGATPRLHGLSLPPGLQPGALDRLVADFVPATGSVQDHHTLALLLRHGLPWVPSLAAYAERTLPADPALADMLPEGPAPVALILAHTKHLQEAMVTHEAYFRRLLAGPAPLLPIPFAVPPPGHQDDPDDCIALRWALRWHGGGRAGPMPPLLDGDWWRRVMTPARALGLIRRCVRVVSSRDLGIALAAAAGVPCDAIGLTPDDPATRAGATLAAALHPDSSFRVLM